MAPIGETDAKTKSLSGAAALVTGGSRGIGKAIAQKLAELGANVAICGRDENALKESEEMLSQFGVKTYAQKADVTNAEEITEFVSRTEEKIGPLKILVNNVGIGAFGAVHEKSESDWDKALDTNLKSVFLVSRAVVPGMIRRGGGDIVNISSLAGKSAFAGGGLYCASKWGLQGLSGCMAEELREHGIRVSVVNPGSVATEFAGRGPKDSTKVLLPEDVAHAVGMIVTQGPQSFLSEISLRPVRRP